MTEPRYHIETSDHHRATGGPDDAFDVGTRRERYWKFLDYVQDMHARYLLGGDIGDCLIANGPAIFGYYRREFDREASMDTIFIPGNHDAQWLGRYDTVPRHQFFDKSRLSYDFRAGDRTFLSVHGHEGDRYCDKPYPDLDAITALITARRARRRGRPQSGGRPYADLAAGVVEKVGTIVRRLLGKSSRLDETIDGLEQWRVASHCDVILAGHTHIAGRIGDHQYNRGCWCGEEGGETFLQIDCESGEVKLFRWTMDCQAVEFDHVLR